MAATTIDELVVVLGLDASKFTDGQKEAIENFRRTRAEATRTAKEMEAQGKRAAEFYGQIKKEALGLFAVVVGQGSLDSYIKTQTNNLVQMGVAAKNAGVEVRELSAWSQVVVGAGGSREQAQGTLTGLATTLTGARTGRVPLSGQFAQYFSQIGGQVNDDPVAVIEKLARYRDSHPGISDAMLTQMGQGLGLDPYSIFEAQKGERGLRADYDKSLANVPSTDAMRAAQDLKQSFTDLSGAIVKDINEDFIPLDKALKPLLGWLTVMATKYPQATGAVAAIIAAAIGVSSIITMLRLGLQALGLGGGAAAGAGATVAEGEAANVAAGGLLSRAGPVGFVVGASLLLKGDSAPYNPQYADWTTEALTNNRNALIRNWGFYPKDGGVRKEIAGMQAELNRRLHPEFLTGASSASSGASILSYLTSHGVSAVAARGVVAGISAEGGAPNAYDQFDSKGRGAFGIGQWRGKRLSALLAKYGKSPSLAQQEEFLLSELKGGDPGGAAVLAAQSSAAATRAYLQGFMRPGGGLSGDLARAGLGGSGAGGDTIITINMAAPAGTDPRAFANALRRAISQANLANRGLS